MRTAKKRREAPSKYTFSISNDDSMLFWSKDSIEHYLSDETEFVKKTNILSTYSTSFVKPTKVVRSILSKYGIKAMAFSKRMSSFYQYLKPVSHTNIGFIVSGKLSLRNDSLKLTINAGQGYILPCGETCYMRVLSDNTSIFWVDASTNSEIHKRVSKNISVQNFKSFEEITSILRLYQKEIYGKNDSQILECYASTFYSLLMREFSNDNDNSSVSNKVKNIIEEIKANPSLYRSSSDAAKALCITIYELDKISLALFGETFAKYTLSIRMKAAMNLLKYEKFSCAKIAGMVGYSSAFSFSYAFKKYFGQSPQTIRQTD